MVRTHSIKKNDGFPEEPFEVVEPRLHCGIIEKLKINRYFKIAVSGQRGVSVLRAHFTKDWVEFRRRKFNAEI